MQQKPPGYAAISDVLRLIKKHSPKKYIIIKSNGLINFIINRRRKKVNSLIMTTKYRCRHNSTSLCLEYMKF